ncbi:hypothetical protein BX600DRAFT_47942 [Xylariales sp. PMI_506]|nr:hypothetical protein BX600DRAFT_47942 [Xylariales sp. PMI_506]
MAALYRTHSVWMGQPDLRSVGVDRPQTWNGSNAEKLTVGLAQTRVTRQASHNEASIPAVGVPHILHNTNIDENKARMRRLPTQLSKIKAKLDAVKPREPFTVPNQLQRKLFNAWLNILLL